MRAESVKGGQDQPAAPKGPARVAAATLGQSVVIKGEVFASEDLIINGQVEGRVELRGHSLTIGATANVKADVSAEVVTIQGTVTGNILAGDKIDLRESASVVGDLIAPRIVIADGAQVRGRIETERKAAKVTVDKPMRAESAKEPAQVSPAQVPELVAVAV
jgi:cytoskeletal protein CcmA (bactofilin family)